MTGNWGQGRVPASVGSVSRSDGEEDRSMKQRVLRGLLQKLVFDAFVENRVSIFQRVTAVKNRTF
jgi:hypothetical protein